MKIILIIVSLFFLMVSTISAEGTTKDYCLDIDKKILDFKYGSVTRDISPTVTFKKCLITMEGTKMMCVILRNDFNCIPVR